MLEEHVLKQIQRVSREPAAVLFRGGSRKRLKKFMDQVLTLYNIDREDVDVDVHFFCLPPEEKSLGVDLAREITNVLTRPPLRSPKRTVIIEDADLLTTGAGNALLKPLEEIGKVGTHRVLVSATETRSWPSPLLSRFLIYDLHTTPHKEEDTFAPILRQGDPELQDFWSLHEDSLYTLLEIIFNISKTPSHILIKSVKEIKVLEESPAQFLQGMILALMHVDMYLLGRDIWRLTETFEDKAKTYGIEVDRTGREALIVSLVAVLDWCKRASGMGSALNHVLSNLLVSKYHVKV